MSCLPAGACGGMSDQLFEDCGVGDLVVACEEHDLGDYFCGAWVVVGEGQKDPAAVLGADRDDALGIAGAAVYLTRSELNRVGAKRSTDARVVAGQFDVAQSE